MISIGDTAGAHFLIGLNFSRSMETSFLKIKREQGQNQPKLQKPIP